MSGNYTKNSTSNSTVKASGFSLPLFSVDATRHLRGNFSLLIIYLKHDSQ